MPLAVCENLLFFMLTVQARGQDKITEARQEIKRVLLGLLFVLCYRYSNTDKRIIRRQAYIVSGQAQ